MAARDDRRSERMALELLAGLADRLAVDLTAPNITEEEARERIAALRARAVALFPGKEEAFDRIYAPRLWNAWQKGRRR